MKIIHILTSVLFLTTVISCQKETSTGDNNSNSNLAATTTLNVAYGTDPLQKIDIYLPAGRTTATTKVIIMIHGGAWISGDKAELNAYVDTLKTVSYTHLRAHE